MNCKQPCEDIEVRYIPDLPIDTKSEVPDYFMTVKYIPDPTDNSIKSTFALVPGSSILPNGNLANQFFLPTNNDTLTVGQGQVLPAYVAMQGVTATILPADATHPATCIVTAIKDGMATCQNIGPVNMLGGHAYGNPGTVYYRSSTPGEFTTDKTQTGQYMFSVLSRTQLLLNVQVG